MKQIFRSSGIPLVLIPFLVVSPIWAQSVPTVPDANSRGSSLELRVLEEPKSPGVPLVPAKRLTVQVRDENGRPVSDAAIAFRLPDNSLSGAFADGAHSAVAYTDASGVAHVDGIRWIASSGSVPVRITASKGNSHAGLLFEEKLSETTVPQGSLAHLEDASPKATIPTNTPAAPVPGIVAGTEQPKTTSVSAAAEVAAVVPAARPSVSIASFSKPSSAASNSLRSNLEPSVSISSSPQGYSNHSGLKKWLILTAVAAAGAGAAFALSGRSSGSSTTSSSSSTIGTPTINIGH
ncbi:MAG: hypothetical protein ACJ74Y_10570 [Bryobacteraceae bacterium]